MHERLPNVDPALAARLHDQAGAARWDLPLDAFRAALDASAAHAFAGRPPVADALARYASGLHLADLALAVACAAGHDAAWTHFIAEHRPGLYRAADAIDPTGGARELADALYADLYGLQERDGARRSLFRYFHGRSSLATWLRAVLAQRHVDRLRADRRLDPLPDEDAPSAPRAAAAPNEPERDRFVTAMDQALRAAIEDLPSRDRLRLGCYYAQDLTLAAIGRLLGEHEATVSRHLSRTRAAVRAAVERRLHDAHGLDAAAIVQCFQSLVADPGSLDLAQLIGANLDRKNPELERSK